MVCETKTQGHDEILWKGGMVQARSDILYDKWK